MTIVGSAFVEVSPKVAASFGSDVVRDVNGKMRSAQGQFVKAGTEAGTGIGKGVTTGLKGEESKIGAGGKDAGEKYSSGFSKEADSSLTKSMRSTVTKLALIVGGAEIGAKAFEFVKGGIDVLVQLDKLNAQTGATIKSTGGAANVTQGQITGMAAAIERLTGVNKEGIQNAENLLLTFTHLKNGVGAGKDIFNQATKAAVNMAVALGKDPRTAALQLGKALNDPIKGISALTRVGVQFSDQQKKSIASMVQSGNLMGAQKLILAQLATRFGGSAAAFGQSAAGQAARVQAAFRDLKETLAAGLLPALTALSGPLSTVIGALAGPIGTIGKTLGAVFTALAPALEPLGTVLSEALTDITPLIGVFGQLAGVISSTFVASISGLLVGLKPVITALSVGLVGALKIVGPFLQQLGALIGGELADLGPVLATGLETVLKALAPILPVVAISLSEVVKALAGFLPALTPIIPLLANGMVSALKLMAPNIPLVAGAFTQLIGAFLKLLPALMPLIPPIIKLSTTLFSKVQLPIIIGLADAMSALVTAITPLITIVSKLLGAGIGKVADLLAFMTKAINPANITKFGDALGNAGKAVARFFQGIISNPRKALDAVGKFFTDLPGQIGKLLSDGWKKIGPALDGLATTVSQWVIQNGPVLLRKFASLTTSALSWIGSAIAKLPGLLAGVVVAIGRWLVHVIPQLDRKFLSLDVSFLKWVGSGIAKLPGLLGGVIEAVGRWVVRVGPKIAGKVVDLAVSLLGWVIKAVFNLPGELLNLEMALWKWIIDVGPKIAGKVADLAGSLLSWIGSAVEAAPGQLLRLAETVFQFLIHLPANLLKVVTKIGPGIIKAMLGIGKSIMNGIVNGITGAVTGAASIAVKLFNSLAGFINAHIIDKVKDFSISVFGAHIKPFSALPDIPFLADGAILNRPGLFVGGEAGREVVIPLEKGRQRALDLAAQSGLLKLLGAKDQSTKADPIRLTGANPFSTLTPAPASAIEARRAAELATATRTQLVSTALAGFAGRLTQAPTSATIAPEQFAALIRAVQQIPAGGDTYEISGQTEPLATALELSSQKKAAKWRMPTVVGP